MGFKNKKNKNNKENEKNIEKKEQVKENNSENNTEKKGFFDMFKKKENNQNNEQIERKRNKNEMLEYVLNESVISMSLKELEANEKFSSYYGENKAYGCLYLNTMDIGGLGKKFIKQADGKGQIIENIKNSTIKAIITKALLAEDSFLIIPDPDTIDTMSEFSILTDAPYKLAYVIPKSSDDIEIIITDIDVKFTDAEEILKEDFKGFEKFLETKGRKQGETNLEGELDVHDEVSYEEDEEDEEENSVKKEDLNYVNNEYDDQDIFSKLGYIPENVIIDDDVKDYVYDGEVMSDEEFFNSINELSNDKEDDVDNNTPYTVLQHQDNNDDAIIEEENNSDYSLNEVMPTNNYDTKKSTIKTKSDFESEIERVFSKSDLNVNLSTKDFDDFFGEIEDEDLFDENRPDGFLNSHLNNMSREFNKQIIELRRKNRKELKQHFEKSLSEMTMTIVRKHNIYDTKTSYGKRKEEIDEQKNKALENISERIKKEKDALIITYEENKQKAGEKGRVEAENAYEQKNKFNHDRTLNNLEAKVTRDIENEFKEQYMELQTERQISAENDLDYLITSTIEICQALNEEYRKEEKKLYDDCLNKLLAFNEGHMKDEMIRTDIEKQRLIEQNKVADLTSEYTTKMRGMVAEFDAKISSLNATVERLNAEHTENIAKLEKKHSEEMSNEKAKFIDMKDEYRKAKEEFTQRLSNTSTEFSNQIKIIELDKEHIIKTNKRNTTLGAIFTVTAIVACLCVGFIVGQYVKLDAFKTEEELKMIEMFSDKYLKDNNNSNNNEENNTNNDESEDKTNTN